MAGPWFAVHRVGDDWKKLDKIWISNGDKSDVAVVQAKLEFAEERDENESKLTDGLVFTD